MILEVPFYGQELWWTCGPACLRMVLAAAGHEIDERAIADACGGDETGTTCDELAAGARGFGFLAEVVRGLSFRRLQKGLEAGIPLIALVDAGALYYGISGSEHLVVVVGLHEREVVFHDPERGANQRASFSRFWNAWGECEYLGVRVCEQTR